MSETPPNLVPAIHDAFARAHDAFNNFDFYLHTSFEDRAAFHGAETDEAVSELALKLLAAFEYLRLSETSSRFLHTIRGLSPTALQYSEEMGGTYSPTLEAFRPYVEIIDALAGPRQPATAAMAVVEVLEQILRSTARYLYLRNIQPTSESHIQREMFPVLRAAFPDTIRELPIKHAPKAYKVDFAVPAIKALVEYKFCNSKADWPKSLDEAFADMKGYGTAPEWQHLFIVFYLTDRYTTQDEVNAEFIATSSTTWKPLVVFGSEAAENEQAG